MEASHTRSDPGEPPRRHRRSGTPTVVRAVAFAIGIAVPVWVAAGLAAWVLLR